MPTSVPNIRYPSVFIYLWAGPWFFTMMEHWSFDGRATPAALGGLLSCELLSTPAAFVLHLYSKNRPTLKSCMACRTCILGYSCHLYGRALALPLVVGVVVGGSWLLATLRQGCLLSLFTLFFYLKQCGAPTHKRESFTREESHPTISQIYYRHILKRQTLKILLLDAKCTWLIDYFWKTRKSLYAYHFINVYNNISWLSWLFLSYGPFKHIRSFPTQLFCAGRLKRTCQSCQSTVWIFC